MKSSSVILFTNNKDKNSELIKMLSVHSNLSICSFSSESWADIDFYSNKNVAFILDEIPREKDAIWIISKLSEDGLFSEIPVLFTSFDAMYTFETLGFTSFAFDILPTPFNYETALRRLDNISEIRQLKLQIFNLTQIHTKRILNQANKLKEQSVKMQAMNYDLVELLVAAIESRDMGSGQHIKRIRYFTKALTNAVMEMCPEYGITQEQADFIYYASSVHDVGKIAIPDAIMLKPGRLTPDEFEVMKTHTTKGAELLGMLDGISESNMYFKYCQDICLYHHERWDGKGYPCGFKGDETPISAQIVSVADCYDALTSHRSYKKALSHDDAVDLIFNGACGSFSPKLLECFSSVLPEFAKIENELKSKETDLEELVKQQESFIQTKDNSSATETKHSRIDECEKSIIDAYDIVFEADIVDDYFVVKSGVWDRIFSYTPKNFSEFVSQCYKMCHPSDAARFASKVNVEAFSQLALLGRNKTRVEFRIVRDNVEYLAVGFIIFVVDENKKILKLDGAFNIYNDDEVLSDIKRGFGVTDGLTGLLVPKQFEKDVDSYIASDPNSNNIMIHIDIDDMSICNSLFGYEYGNSLIKEFASKLRNIDKDKIVCKAASDKFMVFVKNIKSHAEMVLLIENIHSMLKKPYHTSSESGFFTATLGVARYPNDGKSFKNLSIAAEYASKAAKVNGKGEYAFYNNGMNHLATYSMEYKDSESQNSYEPKFAPIVSAYTGELVCYDYIPFSMFDDDVAVTTEVYYELNKSTATRKNLSILSIKTLIHMLVNLKKSGKLVPPVAVYTMLLPDDLPSVIQELESICEENDCSGLDVCIILPQDFLEDISVRKLKTFSDFVKKIGFSLGLYLIGTRYIHNNCYIEDIFDRYVVTSEYIENTISKGANDQNLRYAASTLNNLDHYVSNITIPTKVSDFQIDMMKSAGSNDFSCAEKPVFGVNSLLVDFALRTRKAKVPKKAPQTGAFELDPKQLYIDMSKSNCAFVTYDLQRDRVYFSQNANAVFGFDISSTINRGETYTINRFIHPDDKDLVYNNISKASVSLTVSDFKARFLGSPDGSVYNEFFVTVVSITDENGTPIRLQMSMFRIS